MSRVTRHWTQWRKIPFDRSGEVYLLPIGLAPSEAWLAQICRSGFLGGLGGLGAKNGKARFAAHWQMIERGSFGTHCLEANPFKPWRHKWHAQTGPYLELERRR